MKIRAAAILHRGKVYTLEPPARHHNLILLISKEIGGRIDPEHEQGFVTQDNEFVTREEAARIARESGQITKWKSGLFSEDLW